MATKKTVTKSKKKSAALSSADLSTKIVVKATVKQRNAVAVAAINRTGSGAHDKGATAKRKALDKVIKEQLDGE
jgi:hypothetical protein